MVTVTFAFRIRVVNVVLIFIFRIAPIIVPYFTCNGWIFGAHNDMQAARKDFASEGGKDQTNSQPNNDDNNKNNRGFKIGRRQ